jgi:hypothetical protein
VTYETRTGAQYETATASREREILKPSNERDRENSRGYRLYHAPDTVPETAIDTIVTIVAFVADTGIRGRRSTSYCGLTSAYTTSSHTNKTHTGR